MAQGKIDSGREKNMVSWVRAVLYGSKCKWIGLNTLTAYAFLQIQESCKHVLHQRNYSP